MAESLKPDLQDLVQLARADLWCFVELFFPVLHPNQKIVPADYLVLLAEALMAVEGRIYQRVIFNLPPRHMKSLLVSVFYTAWRLGREPTAKFICISYGDDLAHEHSALTRKVMQHPLYQKVFPGTVLEKVAVDHLRTMEGGQRYATSVGSDITGFGADEIIIDDPMQPHEAGSERKKEELRQWVGSSVETRFDDPRRAVLLLVMHRLAPDDLSATLERSADLTLRLALVCEAGEEFENGDGNLIMSRDPGDILNPAQMSAGEVEKLKATLPSYVFASQYQQQPTTSGSGMLPLGYFARYDLAAPPKFELTIHSWDIGATINGNATVCTKWGLVKEEGYGDRVYLTNVLRLQMQLPAVRDAIKLHDKRDRPALIILDERGVGLGLYQELKREGFRHITGVTGPEPLEREGRPRHHPNSSKIERFGRAAWAIEKGRVVIPSWAPWLEAFLYEVASFPNITDKDQVDSMTQLLAYLDTGVRRARQNKERFMM